MMELLFGALCALLFIKVVGGGRRWRRGGCGHPGGWRGERRSAGSRFAGDGPRGEAWGRAFAEVVKRRLDIDEDQEDLVDHAVADLREALAELRRTLRETRAPLAAAFQGDKVDEAAVSMAFGTHDEAIGRARRSVLSALKQIHAVLTPEQRAQASEWLARDDARWA